MTQPGATTLGLTAILLLTVPLLAPEPTHAQHEMDQAPERPKRLMATRDDVEAEVISTTTCCPSTIRLRVRSGGIEKNLYLSGRIETVRDLTLVGDDRLLLAGNLPMSGGTTLHLADLHVMQQEQVIRTYGYGVSPSRRWLVYQTHYPRMVPPEARRSIFLLYDLSKPPSANRAGPETEWPEPNLGQPIFPEENVEDRTWSIFAADLAFHRNSPFLWSESEDRLVFIASTYLDPNGWPTCYIVSIHLSDDGRVEAIRRRKLSEENVEMPFRVDRSMERRGGRPLCLGAESIEWAEEGNFERIVAEPAITYGFGRKVWIEVP